MPVFNYPKKEVNVKVVYYGPGLSGKTTNLQKIHEMIKPDRRGKLVSLATQTDRTLFFDFMPLELGSIGGYTVRLHLYTVPGQVHYNATRKLVLKGVDGVVFVADSQKAMTDTNVESIHNLEKNLQSYGKSLVDIPHIIQANKRDLEGTIPLGEINSLLNHHGAKVLEAVASQGKGVMETLTEIVRMVIQSLRDQFVTETDIPKKPARGASSPVGEKVPPAVDPEKDQAAEDQESLSEPEVEPEPEHEPEHEPELEPEAAAAAVSPTAEVSLSASSSEAVVVGHAEEERESPGGPGQEPLSEPVPGAPLTITLPVEGLGTVQLTLAVSCRLLDGGESRAVEVQVTNATLNSEAPLSVRESGPGPDHVHPEPGREIEGPESVQPVEFAHRPAVESEPLAVPEETAESMPLDRDLPPLDEAPGEPLGAPLDGQDPDDLDIPGLPQDEKILTAEDVNEAPDEKVPDEPSPEEYDPTVPPMEFDFPETETEDEQPRKKGFFGRFKKK